LLYIFTKLTAWVGSKLLINLSMEAIFELKYEVMQQPHMELRQESINQLQPVGMNWVLDLLDLEIHLRLALENV